MNWQPLCRTRGGTGDRYFWSILVAFALLALERARAHRAQTKPVGCQRNGFAQRLDLILTDKSDRLLDLSVFWRNSLTSNNDGL